MKQSVKQVWIPEIFRVEGFILESTQQHSLLLVQYLSICLMLSVQRRFCWVEFATKPSQVAELFIPLIALTLLLTKEKTDKPNLDFWKSV